MAPGTRYDLILSQLDVICVEKYQFLVDITHFDASRRTFIRGQYRLHSEVSGGTGHLSYDSMMRAQCKFKA